MNKKAIKNFAIDARSKLREGVINKLTKLGITNKEVELENKIGNDTIEIVSSGARFTGADVQNRAKLAAELWRREKQTNSFSIAYDTLVEEISYTWFNRIIAIRFMEVNGYLPERQRVLSSEIAGKRDPDIITNLLDTDLYAAFDDTLKNKVTDLLSDGSTAAMDELYQIIFIKQCNSLNQLLPDLFEKINDYTELLFTISYIDENGVIASLLTIPEEDFNVEQGGQIEIIGWMYQYYNTEPKDKVFARGNRKIRADEIPAATQLFTPDWIVRYMVENSLGRYYIDQRLANPTENRTEKEIAEEFGWKYYLPTAEQPEEVQIQIINERKEKNDFSLQELKLIDPSMGSGHILVYAFDLFIQLYVAEGFRERDAVELILNKNLFGLDIDKRAFQLTYFALMMKGRQYSRRILSKGIKPNVYAVTDNLGISETELQLLHMTFPDNQKAQQDLLQLIEGFKNSSDLGSLIEFKDIDFDNLKSGLDTDGFSFLDETITEMVSIGELLQQKYHIAITNPPYMGSSGMNKVVSTFVKKNYPSSKGDLFGVFIERLGRMTLPIGYYAMITQHAWMFLSSFEKLRSKINQQTIINMAHLGTRAFEEIGGEVVQTTAFVISPVKIKNYNGNYLRLVDFGDHELKEKKVTLAIEEGKADYLYHTMQDNFLKIPGQPISYWVSENIFNAFEKQIFSDKFRSAGRMKTHNNFKYVRNFWEVPFDNTSYEKWIPYHDGGDYHKWFGNEDEVVDVRDDAIKFYKEHGGYPNQQFVKELGVTWNLITSSTNSFRIKEENYLYSSAAPTIINTTNEENLVFDALGFLNSSISKYLIQALNPTLNTTVGDVLSLPLIETRGRVKPLVYENIKLANSDWNDFETSWNFKHHPLV